MIFRSTHKKKKKKLYDIGKLNILRCRYQFSCTQADNFVNFFMFSPKCCGLAVLGKVRYMTIADKRQLATSVGNGISTQHVASNSAIYLEAIPT